MADSVNYGSITTKANSVVGGQLWVSTLSGAPTDVKKYALGDAAVSEDGSMWVNTIAGSPGTWTQVGSNIVGTITLNGDPAIVMTFATSKIVPGATSLSLRNHANSADNLLISDAGLITTRNSVVVTSASATSFTVGPNGATTPAFVVDSSAGSLAAGIKVTGGADTGTVFIAATAPTNAALNIDAAGGTAVSIGNGGGTSVVLLQKNTTVTGTASATAGVLKAINSNASAVGMAEMLSNLAANNAANAAELGFSLNNTTPVEKQFGAIRVTSSTVTASSEQGTMILRTINAGTMTTMQTINNLGTQFGGNVGIGTAPVVSAGISLTQTLTGATTEFGVNLVLTADSSGTASFAGYRVQTLQGAASTTTTSVVGLAIGTNAIVLGAGGAITGAYGILVNPQNVAATTLYGIQVGAMTSTGTNYGINIAAPSGGSTNYGVYIAGGDDNKALYVAAGGATVIGTASAAVGAFKIINSNSAAKGMAATFSNLAANSTSNQVGQQFTLNNTTPAEVAFADFVTTSTVVTAGSELGSFSIRTMQGGAIGARLTLSPAAGSSAQFGGSTTASGGGAFNLRVVGTLVANATSDVLYGLQIAPTLTPGSVTGLNYYGIMSAANSTSFTGSGASGNKMSGYFDLMTGATTGNNFGVYIAGGDAGKALYVAAGGATIVGGGLVVTAGNASIGTAAIANAVGLAMTQTLTGATTEDGVILTLTADSSATSFFTGVHIATLQGAASTTTTSVFGYHLSQNAIVIGGSGAITTAAGLNIGAQNAAAATLKGVSVGAMTSTGVNYGVSIATPSGGTTNAAISIGGASGEVNSGLAAMVVAMSQALAGTAPDGFVGVIDLAPTYTGSQTVTRHNYINLENVVNSGGTTTDAAVFRFDAAASAHKALAADGLVAVTMTSLGPTGAQTTIQGWMKINVNGTLRYIPFW